MNDVAKSSLVPSAVTNGAPAAKSRRTEEVLRAFHEEGDVGRTYDLRLLRQLWPFVRPHARGLYLSMALLLVASGLSLVRPQIYKTMLDLALKGETSTVMQ